MTCAPPTCTILQLRSSSFTSNITRAMLGLIIILFCLISAQSAPLALQYHTAFEKLCTNDEKTKTSFTRLCTSPSSVFLCKNAKSYPTTAITVLPRVKTKTKNKQCYRELNQRFKQIVRAVISNAEYGVFCAVGIFTGMNTWCKQSFSKQQLVTFAMIGIIAFLIWQKLKTFIFPSSCFCMLGTPTAQISEL